MNEQTINLAELKVEVPEVNNVIQLTDNVSVELKYPSFDFIKNIKTKLKLSLVI